MERVRSHVSQIVPLEENERIIDVFNEKHLMVKHFILLQLVMA